MLLVAGAEEPITADDADIRRVFGLLTKEVGPKAAVTLTARITGAPRNRVYSVTRGASDAG